MINNNDNDRIFQDSNLLEDPDLNYLFDFNERDRNGMNVFFDGHIIGSFAPMHNNAGPGCCEPLTNHDMFTDWQRNSDCFVMQTTFDKSSATTSTSHAISSRLNVCPTSQYSKPLFQHMQAASTLPENKRLKLNNAYLQGEVDNTFAGRQSFPDKKHSRSILLETEQEQREERNPNDMLSTYPASVSTNQNLPPRTPALQQGCLQQLDSISVYALKCLTDYGFCALDNFMGHEAGLRALSEVMKIESQGLFEDGRLASQEKNSQSVRGDKIFWIDNDTYPAISRLISRMDRIVFKLQKSFPGRSITSRTKPMVACYPGFGAAYRRHVDNSNQDGRLITCLYYLNKDWDLLRDGGMLRLYPTSVLNKVEIEPIFDRILFFWSDSRNPHEVLPAFRNRYAITVWYFDQKEREKAMKRVSLKRSSTTSPTS